MSCFPIRGGFVVNAPIIVIPLAAALLLSTYTDLRWRLIYNWLTLPGTAFFLLCHAVIGPGTFGSSILGTLSLGGVSLILAVLSHGQMGGGDIKLFAMLGAALGWQAGLAVLVYTYVLAGAAALLIVLLRRMFPGARSVKELPMAPFIAAGTALVYLLPVMP
ncbi:MAG: prepilin peptidase [Brevibacillus sp.]|nr:prepilin peptidase [Brevibacillus sp.]